MENVMLSNGMMVLKSNYIKSKTKDLVKFGYTSLIESDVERQLDEILSGEKCLSVIGRLCKNDISLTQPNTPKT
jgi:hypothetical protein